MVVFNSVNRINSIAFCPFPQYPYYKSLYLAGMIIALYFIAELSAPMRGIYMTISTKIITILVFLTLLLGTGSALAFLVPLPIAHGLSVWGTK
jgi:hypothetical protein